jgi:RimJ/RimL family protein N-acetyltransferase
METIVVSTIISFNPLAPSDLPMLCEWIARPHVREWWDSPVTLADIEADYLPVARGESTTRAYIAHLNGRPLGFIQAYVVMGSEEGWWPDERDPGARGIDQFLANEADLGRGLGRAMIRAFVERLFSDPSVTKVQTDPSPRNERAIRCYRAAGFVDQGVADTPDGPALLMMRMR